MQKLQPVAKHGGGLITFRRPQRMSFLRGKNTAADGGSTSPRVSVNGDDDETVQDVEPSRGSTYKTPIYHISN